MQQQLCCSRITQYCISSALCEPKIDWPGPRHKEKDECVKAPRCTGYVGYRTQITETPQQTPFYLSGCIVLATVSQSVSEPHFRQITIVLMALD